MATTVNGEQLLEWFQDPANKSYFNHELLTIKKSPISNGIGVFALRSQAPVPKELDDDESNLLLRVHKSMVLSAQTCAISNLIYEEKLGAMYGLVLAFIYERQLGERSPWFTYIETINYKNSKGDLIVPLCLYADKEKAILKGTEVEFMGGLDPQDLKSHFEVSQKFANKVHKEAGLPIPSVLKDNSQFEEFAAITMAVASRAFEIDNYIELGLVPGADLFNHDPFGNEHVHFVAMGDVCPFCGKDDGCGHEDFGPPDSEGEYEEEGWEDVENYDEDEAMDGSVEYQESDDKSKEEEPGDDFSKLEEFDGSFKSETPTYESDEEVEELEEITMDYVAKIETELKKEEEREKAEEEEERDSDMDSEEEFELKELYLNPDECCDIVLERKIFKNKEVFNTYGELPNSVLLVKYGFAVEDNPYDSICLGPQIVEYRKSHQELEERIDWWGCMGWLLLREQERADEEDAQRDERGGSDADSEEGDDGRNEEKEEEEEEEESWLFNCRIEHPGRANAQLVAVSKLFTMSTAEFEKMIGDEECDGSTIKELLVNSKATMESKKLLRSWIDGRLSSTGDGKTRSGEMKRHLKKADPLSVRTMLIVATLNEKKLLEKALKTL
mgnify:FL=1